MSVATTNKLSEAQKVQVKSLIAKYDGRGWSTYMLVDVVKQKLGISISQPMVAIYRKQMLAETAKEYRGNRQELVAEKIEQLRDIRREAWDAWVRSSEDARKTVEEYSSGKEQVSPDDYVTSEELVKRVETREGRLPDNAYLNTIRQTLDDERKLLGLDEVKADSIKLEMVLALVDSFQRAALEVFADAVAADPSLAQRFMRRTAQLAPVPIGVSSASDT